MKQVLSNADILNLKRWNTPTVYNGWEKVTRLERTQGRFNRESFNDYMPQMGIMAGYAVTVEVQPSNPEHQKNNPDAQRQYMEYLASVPGPKIVIVKDLDHPHIGSFWGEINANMHKALGCVGTITDGCVRDLDEMTNAGMKALARQTCVGHAYSTPVRWGMAVEVFGCKVMPGDLIHADKHGFMAIDPEDCEFLLDAVRFMDANECENLLCLSRNAAGLSKEEFVAEYVKHVKKFNADAAEHFAQLKEMRCKTG
ncbi:RraA family protein [Hungatella sp. SB206]|uniref:RraA family protein n=1 Tax=Hungatella sp. SB206 TaxID=2937758 RepID=UPI003DA9BCF4